LSAPEAEQAACVGGLPGLHDIVLLAFVPRCDGLVTFLVASGTVLVIRTGDDNVADAIAEEQGEVALK